MPRGVSVKNPDGSEMHWPEWRALAAGRVRHVGEPVACVVAATASQAQEAAEAVVVDIDPLPAVTTPIQAMDPTAPQIHPHIAGNLAVHYRTGDAAKVAAAFAAAAHVSRLSLANQRIIVNPMEPRSALALYDADADRYTLHTGSQGVVVTRGQAAAALGVPAEKLRVRTGNVGGSFGMKAHPFPEDICVLFAAKRFGRPVKWTETRSASFVADSHGRAHEMTIELALDGDGRFLAIRLTGFGDLGAYLTQGGIIPATINATRNTVSVYRTPLIEIDTRCVFTNTSPVGAYRGNGRPEANYYVERIIDTAAREMGISPIELRRRNHIQPADLPYSAPSGLSYDSGDFTGLLEEAIARSDWDGYAERAAESRARGKLRGRGIGQFLEVTGVPTNEMGGIRFEADGRVTILTGTLDNGQGHASAFAQLVVSLLGVPFDRIRLDQGDSDALIAGAGSGGSRSLMASGSAFVEASEIVIAKGRRAAAQLLEAAEADIVFERGQFTVVGTNRRIGILDLAAALRERRTPDGLDLPESLDAEVVFRDGVPAFPNGCHVAEVEIDPETGVVAVVRYTSVGDFGNVVNPTIVAGQIHGGIVQGIGQALYERAVYDDAGQLLSGSFMDYAMPRAADVPNFGFASRPQPARTNPLGVKGCGEAGCAGALGSVMNAVVDALAPYGIRHIDMPATPERIWQALGAAQGAGD
jgi:carbon-monoxide dehydrogenase large subunit